LLFWVPRADAGQVVALALDPGARPVLLFDVGRKRKRYYLATPRFALAGGEEKVRIVIPRRPDSLDDYGLTLLRWRPGSEGAAAPPIAAATARPPAPGP